MAHHGSMIGRPGAFDTKPLIKSVDSHKRWCDSKTQTCLHCKIAERDAWARGLFGKTKNTQTLKVQGATTALGFVIICFFLFNWVFRYTPNLFIKVF